VPRHGLGPVEAIAAIRAAGGLPALAHFSEAPSRIDVIQELVEAGLGGIEVYYRSFDHATTEAVTGVADKLRLVPTGGSDYHGDLGTYAEAHARIWVPPEVAEGIPGAGVVGSLQP
jgi:predicted metal-dependent phosphoesterase TrpH